jgi:hypothetical protein
MKSRECGYDVDRVERPIAWVGAGGSAGFIWGVDFSFRPGGPDDAPALTRVVVECFDTYREWMPDTWAPKIWVNDREHERLSTRLGHPDLWCLVEYRRPLQP